MHKRTGLNITCMKINKHTKRIFHLKSLRAILEASKCKIQTKFEIKFIVFYNEINRLHVNCDTIHYTYLIALPVIEGLHWLMKNELISDINILKFMMHNDRRFIYTIIAKYRRRQAKQLGKVLRKSDLKPVRDLVSNNKAAKWPLTFM